MRAAKLVESILVAYRVSCEPWRRSARQACRKRCKPWQNHSDCLWEVRVFTRKTPEQKAADRRARIERKVDQTTARATRTRERQDTARRETHEAARAADIVSNAERLNAEGRPWRFLALGISVMDGIVYKTGSGLHALGPLAGASAGVRNQPSRVKRTSFAAQVAFGTPATIKYSRTTVTVTVQGRPTRQGPGMRRAGIQTSCVAQRSRQIVQHPRPACK